MSLLTVRQRYSFSQVEVESQQQQQLLLLSHTGNITSNTLDYFNSFLALSSSPPHAPWRQRLENLLWIASAAFIVYYGDFRTNLVALLATDPRILRVSFNLGLACLILNLGILLYLVLRLQTVKKAEERLEIVAPCAVPAAAIIGLAAFILFSYALWPIWRLLTLPMLFTLFMALVVVVPYLLPYTNMRLDVDPLRGLYIRSAE